MGGGSFGYILSFGGCLLLMTFVVCVALVLGWMGRRKERAGLEPVHRVRDLSAHLQQSEGEGQALPDALSTSSHLPEEEGLGAD